MPMQKSPLPGRARFAVYFRRLYGRAPWRKEANPRSSATSFSRCVRCHKPTRRRFRRVC